MVKIYLREKDILKEKYISIYLKIDKIEGRIIKSRDIEILYGKEIDISEGDWIRVMGIAFKKGEKILIKAFLVKKVDEEIVNLYKCFAKNIDQ